MVEAQIDRARVFSQRLLEPDPDGKMFAPESDGRQDLQGTINEIVASGRYSHAIKGDIANYFERIYQHNLINLLHGSGAPVEPVTLLEKLLLSWTDKASHGIVQGVFPSDLFGNFYLCGLDEFLAIQTIPSLRFTDDMYLFFESERRAREALVDLCSQLRKEGLSFNEAKTRVLDVERLMSEETELDRLFAEARDETAESLEAEYSYGLGEAIAQGLVDEGAEPPAVRPEAIEQRALVTLYEQRDDQPADISERIEKFCIPRFAALGSDAAVDSAVSAVVEKPHLARTYAIYLSVLVRSNPDLVGSLMAAFVSPAVHSDYQALWPAYALSIAPTCSAEAVDEAIRSLRNLRKNEATRAICAIVIARHGSAAQRRIVRNHYQDEPSAYVRGALLYAARYLPTAERRTCLTSWAGHSAINALIAKAVRHITGS